MNQYPTVVGVFQNLEVGFILDVFDLKLLNVLPVRVTVDITMQVAFSVHHGGGVCMRLSVLINAFGLAAVAFLPDAAYQALYSVAVLLCNIFAIEPNLVFVPLILDDKHKLFPTFLQLGERPDVF